MKLYKEMEDNADNAEYEYVCFSCGFNLIKRNHELTEIQRKRINFINRIKYAEFHFFCICVQVYKIFESNDFGKIYGVLATLKVEKLNINNI